MKIRQNKLQASIAAKLQAEAKKAMKLREKEEKIEALEKQKLMRVTEKSDKSKDPPVKKAVSLKRQKTKNSANKLNEDEEED